MIHDSTWLGRCARRKMRSTGVVGFLLACALLALPAAASAVAPEMRGEWELVISTPSGPAQGTALISVEANSKGEFATNNVLFSGSVHGTFSGTLEGSNASVKVTTEASGPFLASEFTSAAMTVESSGSTLSMTGSGTFTYGTQSASSTLVATRIKTYKQIEEQEAQEKLEREEREARARVRGEWALTLESGPQVSKGTALITAEANAKNEFASSSALFESVIPGAFSGKLEGKEASVTITTEAIGSFPATTFNGGKIVVTFTSNSMSMTGSGTATVEGNQFPATLTATRIRTYQEVAQEIKEREAKEKQEKEALEAKEKAEQEAREKLEREAREKAEREAREKAEREAAEKAVVPKTTPGVVTPTLVSAGLAGKTFTVGVTGLLSLQITNPNPYAISGRVTLVQSGGAGKASSSRHSKKATSFGTASFGISAGRKQVVKLKLSRAGRTELAHHGTVHVLATITTLAGGQRTTKKTFSLTLHAAKARGRH
jgi:hypothetical protein